jgi:hypothetical protein
MKRLILGALVSSLAVAASAADITGKWTAQVPARDGQTRETIFTFKAAGETLTGTVSGQMGENPIAEGQVKGDLISFAVKVSFGGNQMKMLYKGKLAGDEIKLTRTREGGDRSQELTAKRMK